MSMATGASAGPARLPSNTRNATGLRSPPSSRTSTSARPMSTPSGQPYTLVEEVEKLRRPPYRYLDVLDDRLLGTAAQARHGRAEPVPAVEGHQAPVYVGPPVAARPEPAYPRQLQPERVRAPEPVGVPAPQVV